MSSVDREPLPLPSPPPFEAPAAFVPALAALGVTLDEARIAKLGDYLARLVAMNEHVNLTAVTDPVEVWTRHALDALSLVPHLAHLPAGALVLDVGSGGGVPGIPLAIARPDLEIMMVEATQKKAMWLEMVSEALGLDNVTVAPERAEELAETDLAGTFDAVTARAVAKISQLVPWTAPFARPGGHLLFIKGQKAPDELREAKRVLSRYKLRHTKTELTTTGRVVVLEVLGER
jgi:16S rRNA (guanine527-N7)-methyltransferase